MEFTEAEGLMARDDASWIITYTGRQFWPLDPRPWDVDILDIAHALSMSVRWRGHCRSFYSVAEHSILVSNLVGSPASRIFALLHDAAEAYLSDVPSPLKRLMPDYKKAETRLQETIFYALLGEQPNPLCAIEIEDADRIALALEARQLTSDAHPWMAWDEKYDRFVDAYPDLDCMSPKEAKSRFLELFDKLLASLTTRRRVLSKIEKDLILRTIGGA